MPQVPVRYPSGVATSPPNAFYGNYPDATPSRVSGYYSDFQTYNAAEWTVTASSGTSALTPGVGGLLIQSTAAANNDVQANQLTSAGFALNFGQQAWFNINFKLSDVSASIFLAGLANSFATMAPTDGIYFSKAAASATLNLIISKASVTTTIPVGTLVNATAYSVGWYFDGKQTATLFVYSSIGQTAPASFGQVIPPGGIIVATGVQGGSLGPNFPTAVALTMGFGVKATAVAVKTNTVDYVFASQEVSRF